MSAATTRRALRHLACACTIALMALGTTAIAQPTRTAPPAPVLPSFAELEAAGATIGEIRVAARDIFDLNDPQEDKLLFRWANALHIQTRASVIERALLFKTGDKLTVRALDETERLLRTARYLYDVQFRVLAVHDNVVDLEVSTRDTWTLDPGVSAGRAGGANSSRVGIKEYNLLGTGTSVAFGRSKNVDRSSNEFSFSNDRAFGTWTRLAYSHGSNSDGRRDAASVVRPFYARDARWAAGATALRDDRIDSVYNAGKVASQYRHREKNAEVFGGWSQGLVDGWVRRWSLGIALQDDAYAIEPGVVAPAGLPRDDKLVSPFVRYELLEDRYEREQNRNQIGRPEFFALGLHATAQLGWATTGLGSTRNTWLYSGSVSRGFEPWPEHTLLASADIVGRYADGQVQRQRMGVQSQYFLPHHKRWVFYAAASADLLTRPSLGDELLLGGDNGLRGYPLRYQSGTRRALFTLEERYFTDLFVWQLFRIGGAAFVDVGRAWGGGNANTLNPGWLGDAGVGLRIANARSAFNNVLHVDLAFPLNATPDIKKVQLLVKTRISF
jgi:hypothetical protein